MEKHLCWSLFLIELEVIIPLDLQCYEKETSTQVFSSESGDIFKKTYFEKHLRMTASEPRHNECFH